MAKYRGRYKKSRTCANATEVMMELVRVNENCPHGNFKMNGDSFSNKHKCEECGHWQERESEQDDDPCQPCHNSLVCLVWAKKGLKAKCPHAGYFKKHYASGNKKIIGAEVLDELEGGGNGIG